MRLWVNSLETTHFEKVFTYEIHEIEELTELYHTKIRSKGHRETSLKKKEKHVVYNKGQGWEVVRVQVPSKGKRFGT